MKTKIMLTGIVVFTIVFIFFSTIAIAQHQSQGISSFTGFGVNGFPKVGFSSGTSTSVSKGLNNSSAYGFSSGYSSGVSVGVSWGKSYGFSRSIHMSSDGTKGVFQSSGNRFAGVLSDGTKIMGIRKRIAVMESPDGNRTLILKHGPFAITRSVGSNTENSSSSVSIGIGSLGIGSSHGISYGKSQREAGFPKPVAGFSKSFSKSWSIEQP